MTSNADDVNGRARQFIDNLLKNVSANLEEAGEFLASKMAEEIQSGIPPALSPATVKAKGSSTPLIDTGEMMGDITHKMNGDTEVEVGVFGAKAEVAVHHEFGTRTIPERSFMRSALDKNRAGIILIMSKK